jgi:hypothetical protein
LFFIKRMWAQEQKKKKCYFEVMSIKSPNNEKLKIFINSNKSSCIASVEWQTKEFIWD